MINRDMKNTRSLTIRKIWRKKTGIRTRTKEYGKIYWAQNLYTGSARKNRNQLQNKRWGSAIILTPGFRYHSKPPRDSPNPHSSRNSFILKKTKKNISGQNNMDMLFFMTCLRERNEKSHRFVRSPLTTINRRRPRSNRGSSSRSIASNPSISGKCWESLVRTVL